MPIRFCFASLELELAFASELMVLDISGRQGGIVDEHSLRRKIILKSVNQISPSTEIRMKKCLVNFMTACPTKLLPV